MTLLEQAAAYPVEVWGIKPLDVEALIIIQFPHLLDPNYLGCEIKEVAA